MRIYLDNIVFHLQKVGGISVYWSELSKRLLKSDHETILIEQTQKSKNIFRNTLSIDKDHLLYENTMPIQMLRYLPLQRRIEDWSLFHSSYYRISKQKNVVNIVTVYDFIYEHFHKGMSAFVHGYQKKIALKNADGIICISESTKKDLLNFYPWVEEQKVKVIHCGVGDNFVHLIEGSAHNNGSLQNILGKKYILYVGNRSGYKNFNTAVQVLSQLPDFALVIAGGGALSKAEEKMLNEKLWDKYYYVKTIDDHALNILYNHAVCLLYPSSYEGFGIPLVEAMKCGCPVVATNKSSIPEVLGGAGLMVDCIDVHAFVQKIKSLENISFRHEIIEMGYRQARRFSWDTCYHETLAFYGQTYKKKFGTITMKTK